MPTLSGDDGSDSGAGELQRPSGTLHVDIVDGQHHYTFDFELDPVAPRPTR